MSPCFPRAAKNVTSYALPADSNAEQHSDSESDVEPDQDTTRVYDPTKDVEVVDEDDDDASLNFEALDGDDANDVLNHISTSNSNTTSKTVTRTVGKRKTIVEQAAVRKTSKTVTPGRKSRNG